MHTSQLGSHLIAQIAQLEARRLLSAIIENESLIVTGTIGADTITIAYVTEDEDELAKVSVNGAIQTFDIDLIKRIHASGNDGDDSITIEFGRPSTLNGGNGNDTLNGGAKVGWFFGGAGNDLMSGGSTNDVFYCDRESTDGAATSGNDTVFGNASSDEVFSDSGSDVLFGGEGKDYLNYSSRTSDLALSLDDLPNDGVSGETGNIASFEYITSGSGNDSIMSQRKDVTLAGGAGDDTMKGGARNTTMYGGAGNDLFIGGSGAEWIYTDRESNGPTSNGDDTVFANAGEDRITNDSGSDRIDGGSGGDWVVYQRGEDLHLTLDKFANDGAAGETGNLLNVENISGGQGDDLIEGDGKPNQLSGDNGNDTMRGSGGNDFISSSGLAHERLEGGSGNDTIVSSESSNVIVGGSGNDTIRSTGDDTIHGGSGDDEFDLRNFTTVDSLEFGQRMYLGESGNDWFRIRLSELPMPQTINGGSDDDLLEFKDNQIGVQITLDGVANDGWIGGNRNRNVTLIESIRGTKFADNLSAATVGYGVTLLGDSGSDTLAGGSSVDSIEGGAGSDSITGNGGNDRLRGDSGNDILTGNSGRDIFTAGTGNDTILADDDLEDSIDGGEGTDRADVDDEDEVTNVETLT